MKVKEMEKLVERASLELDADAVAVLPGVAEWEQDYGRKARVIAVRQRRRVYSGARSDWGGHLADDGVKIVWLEDQHNSKAGEEAIVGPRQIVSLWNEYAEQRAKRQLRDQERRDGIAEQERRARELAAKLGEGAFATPVRAGWGADLRTTGWRVELSLDLAERLTDAEILARLP